MSLSHYGLERPRFILTGWDLDDGRCRILASRSVFSASLEVRREYEDLWGDPRLTRVRTATTTTLTAEMGEMTIIEAEHWRAILEAVHRNWAPPGVKPWE